MYSYICSYYLINRIFWSIQKKYPKHKMIWPILKEQKRQVERYFVVWHCMEYIVPWNEYWGLNIQNSLTSFSLKRTYAWDVNKASCTNLMQLWWLFFQLSILTLAKAFHFSSRSCLMTPPSNISKWSSFSPLIMIINAEFQSTNKQIYHAL